MLNACQISLFLESCCPTIKLSANVVLNNQVSGRYKRQSTLVGGKPLYASEDGKYCIGFQDNWKVEVCGHSSGFATLGFLRAPAHNSPDCVGEVGAEWLYYGSDTPDNSIIVECSEEDEGNKIKHIAFLS